MSEGFPQLLVLDDGHPVRTLEDWNKKRAPQLHDHFTNLVFGPKPDLGCLTVETVSEFTVVAGRCRVDRMRFDTEVEGFLLVATPDVPEPVPMFVGLGFDGVHTVLDHHAMPIDPVGTLPKGAHASKWPLTAILEAGFGLAMACYQSFCPDKPEAAGQGLLKRTGALSVWAEVLSRIRQVLSLDPTCCSRGAVAIGHSRLGKAALLACARDPEFAAVVPIQSGCGGAAPSRTAQGETVSDITRVFPHWFVPQFASFAGREADLPIDQHALLALCAPRPILLLNAVEDVWANPDGQVRMLDLAREVYGLHGLPDLLEWGTRPGRHEVLPVDWERAIAFARFRLPSAASPNPNWAN